MPASASARKTPICAQPRAEPPPSARPMRGSLLTMGSIRLAFDAAALDPLPGRLAQDGAGDRVGTKYGAALEAQRMCLPVEILETFERDVGGDVDGFRNGVVDEGLERRLHVQMGERVDLLRLDQRRWQACMALLLPQMGGVVDHAMGVILAIRFEYAALRFGGENRFDGAGKIVGEQADGAGRCDGQYMAVADAVYGDGVAVAGRQARNKTTHQEKNTQEDKKRAFLVCELNRRAGAAGPALRQRC